MTPIECKYYLPDGHCVAGIGLGVLLPAPNPKTTGMYSWSPLQQVTVRGMADM